MERRAFLKGLSAALAIAALPIKWAWDHVSSVIIAAPDASAQSKMMADYVLSEGESLGDVMRSLLPDGGRLQLTEGHFFFDGSVDSDGVSWSA